MKNLTQILSLFLLFSINCYGESLDLLKKYSSEVQVDKINAEVSKYISNELGKPLGFKSDYTLAEYKESSTSKIWYILDGYFTLEDGTILFLDFNYEPSTKEAVAINNYVFIAEENKRLLLKAEEICNPYKRNFIGSLYVILKNKGHIDDLLDFLIQKFKVPPILSAYNGTQLVIQDLTVNSFKPLFVLYENQLAQDLSKLDFVKTAMIIPSGRNPSNDEISQTYWPVGNSCR
jgi:hypothetical protein